MRGIQPLAAQQRTDLAWDVTGIGFAQDECLVLSRELAALGLGTDFGVRHWWSVVHYDSTLRLAGKTCYSPSPCTVIFRVELSHVILAHRAVQQQAI